MFHVRPLVSPLKERSSNPLKPEKKSRAQKERRKALPYDQSLQFFADLIDENSINLITQPHQKDKHIILPNDLAIPKPQEETTPPLNSKQPKRRIKPIVLDQISPMPTKENQTITPSPRVIYYPSLPKKLFQDQEEENEIEDDLDDADPLGNNAPKPTPSFIPPPPPLPSLLDLNKPRLIPQKDSEPTTPPSKQKKPKNRIKPIVLDPISPITRKEDQTITPNPRVLYYPSRPKALFQDAEEEEDEIEYEEDDLDDADPINNDAGSYKKVNILGDDAPKPTPSFIPPPPPAPSLQDLNKPRLIPQKDVAEQEDRTI
ncbi:MAG: hypothetical protein Q8K37_03385, partial [Alphaproteobacteria bacterium]|nr:hypothetical protein [Alphaproteobacteria bacterium]